jgi:hypothetical protein
MNMSVLGRKPLQRHSVGKNVLHRIGGERFFTRDTHLVVPYVVDAIRVRSSKGWNPIYIKSAHIVEDYDEQIKADLPDFHKKGQIYSKQMVSKILRVMGFDRKATNHKDSAFVLRW